MGGKPENLKKAILTGKGNKNKEVNGLGAGYDPLDGLDETSDASAILGTDMYHDELSGVEDDFGELGVVTATAIASATGVIGAIAALLKSVGNIFPKKGKGKEGEGLESGGEGGGSEEGGGGSSSEEGGGSSDEGGSNVTTKSKSSGSSGSSGSEGSRSGGVEDDASDDSNINGKSKSKAKEDADDDKPEGFWNKNKKWLKPVAIGVGSLGLLFAGYKIVTHKKAETTTRTLSGIPRSRKKRKKQKHFKSKKHKKESVALL